MSLLGTGIKTVFSSASPATWLAIALAALLALGAATWRGYAWGYDVAETRGRAELAEYRAQVADAEALASDAARRVLAAEILRRDQAEADLGRALQTVAAQRREITKRRIADAARDVVFADGAVLLGPDWLCLYNRALGLGDGHCLPRAASGPDGGAEPASGPDAGVLRAGRGVTPADILAHARDVGRYMAELRTRYLALIAWADGLPRTQTEKR
jgi:hypothetical protein